LIVSLGALTTTRNPESINAIRGRELIVDSSDMMICAFGDVLGDGSREEFALHKDGKSRPKYTARFTGMQLRDLSTCKLDLVSKAIYYAVAISDGTSNFSEAACWAAMRTNEIEMKPLVQ
jgi:hypothetical protein